MRIKTHLDIAMFSLLFSEHVPTSLSLQKHHLVSTCFSLQSEQKKRRKNKTGRRRKIFLNVNEAFSRSDFGRELNDYNNMNRIVYVPIQETYNQNTVTQV